MYKTLILEEGKYKTLLTKKYEKRKPYMKPNIKDVLAFMPGIIGTIYVKKRMKVKEGDKLFLLEAMKIHNVIISKIDGIIESVEVKTGDSVIKGQLLIKFK